ncbi:MAG: diacylglycerol kinase family lipid kinase [Deltaproteobacteria bacterium]|nr:diacylglycerol kinase family lipid kinase [Deltaproteobacteria bacterium]MBW1738871.1 diacylglycerol kinase family lipid kinase [Deltaproteobacteria bacterium]MBW1909265.1 diacylglycerol kinase family lipid kinase [Deltaproteobacteria bacterium]MBW2035581.1 diacylglycerol kinase family lipid kinase [Deltaproteobacteria bacterium]MBW2168890.1 diacylglycerol kinase family lipid kinase [Deltaproteobacteria bacterium]
MASKKITFIVNPNSSNGATGKEWPRIQAKATDILGSFTTCLTTSQGHATRLARQAIDSGSEIVVCVGGDGTLNEVINGFVNEKGSIEQGVLLGFIPRGTGCDFVKSISIPSDPDKGLKNILSCRYRTIDLGRLTYQDHDGGSSCLYFHNVLSFGLGGEVDERVNRTTKVFGGFVSFILATLISILLYSKKRIQLRVDDYFDEEVTCWNVAVANGQYHGGGMLVAPGASLSDGLFQITVLGDLHLAQVFWNLPRLYNGKIYEHKKITKLTGRRIEASSSQQVLLDMDGEQPGCLPAVVEIVPSAIRIISDD